MGCDRLPSSTYKALGKLHNLEELHIHDDIHNCSLYIHHTEFSTLCAGLKSLRKLDIYQSRGVTDLAMASITQLTSLEELCISGCQITSKGLTYISAVNNLTALDISETAVHDYGISLLTKLLLLRSLVLRDCWNITGLSMSHINKLVMLDELNVAGCPIGPQGLFRIMALKKLSKLHCDGGLISDRSISHISTYLPDVKEFVLTGCCAAVNDKSREYLRSVKVHHAAGMSVMVSVDMV